MIAVVIAMWRGILSIRDNTAKIERLAVVVEGAANTVGLAERVRHLEDWRTATEAVRVAEAHQHQVTPS